MTAKLKEQTEYGEFLRVVEAARYKRTGKDTIYKLISKGKLKTTLNEDGVQLIKKSDIDEYQTRLKNHNWSRPDLACPNLARPNVIHTKLVPISQAAKLAGVQRQTLAQLVQRGKLSHYLNEYERQCVSQEELNSYIKWRTEKIAELQARKSEPVS